MATGGALIARPGLCFRLAADARSIISTSPLANGCRCGALHQRDVVLPVVADMIAVIVTMNLAEWIKLLAATAR